MSAVTLTTHCAKLGRFTTVTKMPTVYSKILIVFTVALLFRTLDVGVDINEHIDEHVEYPLIFNNTNIA